MSHMSMKYPYPRDRDMYGRAYAEWQRNEPMIPMHPQICHGLQSDATIRTGNTFSAGQSITMQLAGTVPHGGGHCTFWYSTDDRTFTKIVDIKDCTYNAATDQSNNMVAVVLPSTMPTQCRTRCTFAWTWVPVHSGACEIYMGCADISVSNANGGISNPISVNFHTSFITAAGLNRLYVQ